MPEPTEEGWGPLREELAADVRRVADRLRSLSQARLAAPVPPHATRADAARQAAAVLATAAQGVEERARPTEPAWRTLPALADFAVGDQVAVTGQDLVAAAAGVAADAPVWAPGGRRRAGDVVAEAAEVLSAVRRLL